jgi:hypothetical protein
MLASIGTHLHDTNAKHFHIVAKHDRPHPASEAVFVNFVSTYLRTIRGEKAVQKFEEELGRLTDRTSKSGLLRAIAKAKNAEKTVVTTQVTGRPFRKGNNFHKRGSYTNNKPKTDARDTK